MEEQQQGERDDFKDEFDNKGSLGEALPFSDPVNVIITVKRLDDWMQRLDFETVDEATNFGLSISKCLEWPDKNIGQEMAKEVLRIARARCSVKAKRVNKVAEVLIGRNNKKEKPADASPNS